MTDTNHDTNASASETLNQQADIVRTRMLTRVATLEWRRRSLSRTLRALGAQAKLLIPATVGVGVITVAVVGVVFVSGRYLRSRPFVVV